MPPGATSQWDTTQALNEHCLFTSEFPNVLESVLLMLLWTYISWLPPPRQFIRLIISMTKFCSWSRLTQHLLSAWSRFYPSQATSRWFWRLWLCTLSLPFFAFLCTYVVICCILFFLLLLVFFLVHKASSVSSLRLAESTSAMATEDRPQHDLDQRPSPESRWELALHRRRDHQRRSEIGERKTSILQCRDDHYIHHT